MKCIKTLLIIAALIFADNSIAQLPGCGTSIAAFPYNEGFEGSFGNWTDDVTEQFNWTRDSGGTTSGGTGPTTGSAASTWYMYIETSSPRANGDQAWLESDCFNFGALTAPQFEFDYHMYGAATGTLDLRISTDGVVWTSIWALSGNQGNSWQTASVDLTAYAGLTVGFQFRGTRGTSYTGDIAIDNIYIYDAIPMSYSSAIVTQSNTSSIENCSSTEELIRVEVITTGTLLPISLTQITTRTDGSTSPMADIAGITLYYTGASGAFSGAIEFGTSGAVPTGTDVIIGGTQALMPGSNYFWIAYDVAIGSNVGNTVDAICTDIEINGASVAPVPAPSAPLGGRIIVDCLRACPVNGTLLDEQFETGPIPGWIPGTTYGSTFNSATYLISGTNHGWFNLVNGLSNVDVLDISVEGLYMQCEVSVSYWAAKTYGVTDVEFNMYDDNGILLAQNAQSDLSNTMTLYTHTFMPTTPGIRFVLHFNSTGGSGIDVAMEDLLITQCCDVPVLLPVELINLEVTNEECSNLIEWSTASESNSDYYVIERSYDLAQWEQLGTVSGAGNSTATLDYIYRDNDFEINGMIYYRIVQFDFDGANSEIGLQVVNSFCEDNYEPIAYPNPVTNELSIKSMLAGRVTVMDLNGRIVSQSEVAEGTTVVGMSHLTQGTYMMTIELSNGKTFMSQLFKI
jgi:hypothetical protein